MSGHLQRARLLFEQGRHEPAERELRALLAEDPDEAEAHALLAFCLVEQRDHQGALDEAQTAIHIEPDEPFMHYVLAVVQYQRSEYRESLAAIEECLRLDPTDPDAFSVLAHVHLARSRWSRALEAAEEGLGFDPDHADCANARTMALSKLGRRAEADHALDEQLARDPLNAETHAARGWQLLERGDTRASLDAFKEALRLDPELGWARDGIAEALKARNPIYRLLLNYFLWMSRLSGGARWGVLIGAYIGFRILRNLTRESPGLAPLLWPIMGAYIAFALLTWIGDPVFNLILRLHPLGRHALSEKSVREANLIGALLGLALLLVAVVIFAEGRLAGAAFFFAVFCVLFSMAVSGYFNCTGRRAKRAMLGAVLVHTLFGVAMALTITNPDLSVSIMMGYLIVAILTPWYSNYFIGR